jgi:hypothetical protein
VNEEHLFALVNGKRTREQFSFSSPELLDFVSDYILENYGNGEKKRYRFMIMPNDNDLVCTCPACTELGNTSDNATPAVADFIRKLAQRFPKHSFFTAAYRTTKTAPAYQLWENGGVFFSTIDLPKGVALDNTHPKTAQFLAELSDWREKTEHIYLWDYAANFDDYLTPIPILFGLQQQFRFFKENGVKGIFLNASGYDYAPFDDLKTFVTGELLKNRDADIDMLCRQFYKEEYPVSGTLLGDYYLSLERKYADRMKAYNIYGSMQDNLSTYFDADDFVLFYEELKSIMERTENREKEKLQKLYTALSYTRLQIAYVRGSKAYGYALQKEKDLTVLPEVTAWVQSLSNYMNYPDLQHYKETGGELSAYLSEWNMLIEQHSFKNLLLDIPIQLLSEPDEGFHTTTLLNDGVGGFPQDYHQGWYLSSVSDLHLFFSTAQLQQATTIRLRFLESEKQGIYPPEKIEVIADGKIVKTVQASQMSIIGQTSECIIEPDFSATQRIEVKCYRKSAQKSIIACDEIQIL